MTVDSDAWGGSYRPRLDASVLGQRELAAGYLAKVREDRVPRKLVAEALGDVGG